MEETSSSSSSSSVPLITRRHQLATQRDTQNPTHASTSKASTSSEAAIPRKAINILRSEHPENRRKARTKLLEILMDRLNLEAGKPVIVDIDSKDEIDETLNELKKEKLLRKKRIWLRKVDDYSRTDSEF